MPLDVGVGLLLGVLLDRISELPYAWCLSIGVIATLLPDIDYILSYFRHNKQPDTTHRDLVHYPLILLPLIACGLFINVPITKVMLLGSMLHFIHDSFGIGFGLKWLYPIRKNSYLFFFQTKTPRNRDMPKPQKYVYSWTDEQRAEMLRLYGDPDWIRHIYLRFHPFGLFEYSGLLVGIVVAVVNAPQ